MEIVCRSRFRKGSFHGPLPRHARALARDAVQLLNSGIPNEECNTKYIIRYKTRQVESVDAGLTTTIQTMRIEEATTESS